MKKYRVVGVMSGSSLDGLDIAFCEFEKFDDTWKYEIIKAQTIPYTKEWKTTLQNAHYLLGYKLIELDIEFGKYIGRQVKEFLKNQKNKIDLISSHGHTVFHNPKDGITFQIGNGAAISSESKHTSITNFRVLDVMLKGQGAPLVPLGDCMLFGEYDYCLNLGGFANISYNWYKKRIAYDICPVNIILNNLAESIGLEFDLDGIEASKGILNEKLFRALNLIPYYKQPYPKSLSREWFESQFYPVIKKFEISAQDKLRTVCEHIANQITKSFTSANTKKILITGGGTFNKFLIDCIQIRTNHKIIIPDNETINFKEAVVFAFLGVLRFREENNCLSSVTGATHDNSGGIIFKI
jgi:anhydro-N-acetylmuramic acid kinase